MLPEIRRVVAENPSVVTYHGTNTWLVGDKGGVTIIDPGPESEIHASNVLAVLGGG